MITIEEKYPDVLEVTVSEVFNHQDIKQLMPMLKKYARDAVGSRLLLITRNFQGWYGAGPWWSDLALNDECNCSLAFRRIALIGDIEWRSWMTTFVSSLTSFNKIKFFTYGEVSQAREWLNSREKSPGILG